MSVIETEPLIAEVSPETPGGPDVEYDPEYFGLEKLAQGTPESTMGEETKPAEPPNWKEVKEAAVKLSGRTRDLRVALILALGLLKEDGLPGFRDGVAVLRGFVEKLWDHFYPKLDPDDNNDPTIRVNLLKNLNGDGSAADMYKFKQRLKEATLTNSPKRIGAFGFRDLQIARGEIPAPPAAEGQAAPPTAELVAAAFEDTPTEHLQSILGSVQESMDDVQVLDGALTEKVGAGNGADLTELQEVLKAIKGVLDEQLAKRGIGEPVAADGGGGEASDGAGGGGGGGAGGRRAISGEISSREDVVRMLEKINGYYEKYEPSSPVPIFMNRAKRLVTMNFADVIKDLAPDAIERINVFTGEPPPPAA